MSHEDRTKQHVGKTAYHSGLAAEGAVEREYCRSGHQHLASRWRGTGGEIDLVFQSSREVIFVEVKKSKSIQSAGSRLSAAQQKRIFATATEFVATLPFGQLTSMRFDVALVDHHGQIEILENALFCD